jgi:uncharacterized protein
MTEKISKEIKKIIEGNPLALATVNKNGKPHVIAVADVKIISKDEILIGDNYMKDTLNNLKNCSSVSLVIWNKQLEGYTLKGIAKYFAKGKWVKKVKEIHKGYPAKGAIVIKLNEIKKCCG